MKVSVDYLCGVAVVADRLPEEVVPLFGRAEHIAVAQIEGELDHLGKTLAVALSDQGEEEACLIGGLPRRTWILRLRIEPREQVTPLRRRQRSAVEQTRDVGIVFGAVAAGWMRSRAGRLRPRQTADRRRGAGPSRRTAAASRGEPPLLPERRPPAEAVLQDLSDPPATLEVALGQVAAQDDLRPGPPVLQLAERPLADAKIVCIELAGQTVHAISASVSML